MPVATPVPDGAGQTVAAWREPAGGADWLRQCLAREGDLPAERRVPSALGCAVADILGAAWGGLHRLERQKIVRGPNWANAFFVRVVLVRQGLATCDPAHLTPLVLLCHERAIRLEVDACLVRRRSRRAGARRSSLAPGLALTFHARSHTAAGAGRQHPTVAAAVAAAAKLAAATSGGA